LLDSLPHTAFCNPHNCLPTWHLGWLVLCWLVGWLVSWVGEWVGGWGEVRWGEARAMTHPQPLPKG
jgi:hypothetical protein